MHKTFDLVLKIFTMCLYWSSLVWSLCITYVILTSDNLDLQGLTIALVAIGIGLFSYHWLYENLYVRKEKND